MDDIVQLDLTDLLKMYLCKISENSTTRSVVYCVNVSDWDVQSLTANIELLWTF